MQPHANSEPISTKEHNLVCSVLLLLCISLLDWRLAQLLKCNFQFSDHHDPTIGNDFHTTKVDRSTIKKISVWCIVSAVT